MLKDSSSSSFQKHQIPSEHFSERDPSKGGGIIDTVVIHTMYNAVDGDSLDPKLCKGVLDSYKVSAHYLIDRDGGVWQLVPDEKKAWHAGVSAMPAPDGRSGVNEFSIGIELIALKEGGLTDSQYQSLNELVALLKGKFPLKNIVGHNHIAPGRKDDPWGFDWSRLESAGLSIPS
jgi:N-acetyl-anhydromuramyl-L-alanine amidase AmpD